MRALTFSLCFGGAILLTHTAMACLYAAPENFEIGSDPSDVTPPAAPKARVGRIKRGKESEGCQGNASSCDDLGYVEIVVSDDVGDDVGYVLELSGDYPQVLGGYDGKPLSLGYDKALRLVWIDGDGESELDFEVEVWSVDRAGNMSETPTQLRVRNADGCSARSRPGQAGWFALLCALLLVRRAAQARSSAFTRRP